MKIEFNTLYWSNTPKEQIEQHIKVTEALGFPVNYYREDTRHGAWMDKVCKNSDSDIIGFFDSDCVPISRENIFNCLKYVKNSGTFLGIAQVSNHIPPKSHIYAAPAFYLINKKCWERLNTSFLETPRSDVAEELTYKAESIGMRYRCLYPSTFEREPVEGLWPLGNYGYYGIGTTFENTVYHLYQGRIGKNLELFLQRCEEIIQGKFTNENHFSAKTFEYSGKIVP